MRFEILGSLRITDGKDVFTVTAPKMESLLAAMLVRADDVVSMDQMCTEIWGADPPRRAVATLHVYISQLRKLLGRADEGRSPIVTRFPGYVLELGDSSLDAHEFQRLARQSRAAFRAGQYQEASVACGRALALWRGTVLGELRGGPIVDEFATWAEETRLECVELGNEADLMMGRHRELVGPLYTLVNKHPLIEAFHRQLMLALYRSDRRADALRAFQRVCSLLDRELGITPCRPLYELHQQILADEELRVPAAA
ncbi:MULTISPECIES: AfsR/SARP family transcriptional regulator [unclassified Streptomyces]|uniref:AfsR/SARP family transcriptional regulator n=1 Tax=unclassified Streptomyces TaxID=2593676 RepID=UPI00190E3353|nr:MULTISPECIES: AfsR/SARP family transcriptional regulator [unclassified Streptomyces]MBK3565995.1 AfsR/SARP family transcriptional regulator [Streptomyces sp. MBT62]MBK6014254.1 AfsR/SARP family transcriptional regulator [Streptomyces sp. MBT53]